MIPRHAQDALRDRAYIRTRYADGKEPMVTAKGTRYTRPFVDPDILDYQLPKHRHPHI